MRRILFVDDDEGILSGLRDSLRRQRRIWDMHFALGGQAALEQIAAENFDVVVCDLRMPQVDGVAVLTRVRDQQPGAVRIVLSGHAEADMALEVARVAHLYLAKPCRDEDLRTAIERACRLRVLLQDERLRRTAGGVVALPSCPSIYVELNKVIADPRSSAADAAAVVARDVAMAAKVLQLVNSAFFGLGRRIAAIREAVQYLGLNTLKTLVLHAGAFEAFAPLRAIEGFDIEAVRRRSHLAARIAAQIAPDKPTAEDAFTASMLHEVGLLVLAANDPDELVAVLTEARRSGRPVHEVEYERHGSSHGELGAYVLGIWGLPLAVVDAVAHHHRIDHVESPAFDTTLVVHVASALADEQRPGGAAVLDEAFLVRAGVADRIPEWRELAVVAAERAD